MKEPYEEGLASHLDPESCVRAREGTCEALTGARAGMVLSREINDPTVPTLSPNAVGNTARRAIASACAGRARSETHGRTETSCTGTGRPRVPSPRMARRRRVGKGLGRTPDDGRPRGVGWLRSTEEAREQTLGCGPRGGKEASIGKPI